MATLTGKKFGPYEIAGLIGEGGMAAVYRGYHPATDRYVAVKVLPRMLAMQEEFVQRFTREARVVARLQHPHILPVFDFGEADGYTFLVMPLIEGGSLEDLLRKGPLTLAQAEKVTRQVASALDYAHERGLVHRDIKPGNILVDTQGNCLLGDFGVAKVYEATTQLTGTGGLVGTPTYMAPEQGRGGDIDRRSDVYSLGVVLYEMVTGRVPFQADTPIATVLKHIQEPLPPPHLYNPTLPTPVEQVIQRALEKEPEARFPTAGEMARTLSGTLVNRPAVPPPAVAPEPERRPTPAPQDRPVTPPQQEAPPRSVMPPAKERPVSVQPSAQPSQPPAASLPPVSPKADTAADLPPLSVSSPAVTPSPSHPVTPSSPARRRPLAMAGAIGGLLLCLLLGLGAAAVIFNQFNGRNGEQPTREQQVGFATATSQAVPTWTPRATRDGAAATQTAEALAADPTEETATATATITPTPAPAFRPLSLASLANMPLDFVDPPQGEQEFAGLPFVIGQQMVNTQASPASHVDFPTQVTVQVGQAGAYRLHVLITAGNAFSDFDGQVVGQILAVCDGAAYVAGQLQLGRDLREWHDGDNVVAQASNVQEVWRGEIFSAPGFEGYIDLLTLDLPAECQEGTLQSLEIRDTSQETVGSLDPALNLVAITVEYGE